MAGSSPLTRGKHAGRHAAHARQRLIPAHAGKTLPREEQVPARRAHPRSRGENALDARPHAVNEGLIPAHAGKTFRASRACTSDPGSSPLTRGKRSTEAMNRVQAGLIPAHAGKTGWWQCRDFQVGAHPRSRGENLLLVLPSGAVQGSSPLTRGKPPRQPWLPGPSGLIPAHAGKTVPNLVVRARHGAHPRSRGENTS